MATDPYIWAREFAAQQYGRANQADSDREQSLLNVFTEEAARQRPYVLAPLELEMEEKKAAIQRRYQLMRDADKAAADAKKAKEDAVGGAASDYKIDENGNEVFFVNGHAYINRTAEEIAAEEKGGA
jgi:hypothetical protein